MRPLEVKVGSDGCVMLSKLAPWAAAVLFELDELLAPDQPAQVQRRLFPMPSEDPELQRDWTKHVHPDLFALMATAREVVLEDLGRITPPSVGSVGWELEIPSNHVRAWVSALNAARLTIAELAEIGEAELDTAMDELSETLAPAVARIRLFGWIQELILAGLYPDASV